MKSGLVLALSGGVGGAKLAAGLARALPPDQLAIVVNTADDFDHLGLRICPDLDSVTYALAGENDPVRGWGRKGETWFFMQSLAALAGPDWFQLGDRDLALHVLRTSKLRQGQSLTNVTHDINQAFGIKHRVYPMAETPVATVVETEQGALTFQDYFVRRRCEPIVRGFHFEGRKDARLPSPLTELLAAHPIRAIVICPSNPFVSIGPILAIPGMRDLLTGTHAPIVAVSPFVGGRALKGPASKMMTELGLEASSASLCRLYDGFLHGIVLHEKDRAELASLPENIHAIAINTVMGSMAARIRLAKDVLRFADTIRKSWDSFAA